MNWSYVAGFIDGEGCFTAVHRKNRTTKGYDTLELRFSIGNTDKPILEEIKEFIGTGNINLAYTAEGLKRNGYVSNYYTYAITGMPAMESMIFNLLPHLRIKKRLAELFLEFIALRKTKSAKSRKGLPRGTRYAPYDEEYEIVDKIRAINSRRGVNNTKIGEA